MEVNDVGPTFHQNILDADAMGCWPHKKRKLPSEEEKQG